MAKTAEQYEEVIAYCRETFCNKAIDYGTAWRILRLPSLTDQIYIKANRIRSIQEKGEAKVAEGIIPEFVGIVNYAVMALIQLEVGVAMSQEEVDMDIKTVTELYDKYIAEAKELMLRKNHDYGEAWRDMFGTSLTDIILTKINRNKSIAAKDHKTLISEGCDGNYFDMLNYAIFYLIQRSESSEPNT